MHMADQLRRHGFALVLGGGGAAGIAYCCGALSALADVGGIDARTAKVMIGTSAGAIVAADLRLGRGSDEILEAATGAKLDGSSNHARAGWSSTTNLARRILGSSVIMARTSVPFGIRLPEPPSWLQRAFPGSLMAPSNRDWASDRYPEEWPDGELQIVALDLESGRRVVLRGAGSGARHVNLAQAVRASCAVPGIYPPVRAGGRRLVDRGAQSASNLDLAAQTSCAAVIALVPMGFDPLQPPGYARSMVRMRVNSQLVREAALVRRNAQLLILRPTGTGLRHHRINPMSAVGTEKVVTAAYESTAAQLSEGAGRRVIEFIKELNETPVDP